ncbi:unnamed protein product [Meganyctiphanes norvegica]|uniref:Protein sleepless n=1 Tax=Meganyctiphanes norvegica TaxID=48144 RepID=A0AAV2PQR1_MEGNR
MNSLVLSCLSLLALISAGSALQCHVCNTHTQERCFSDDLTDEYLETCEQKEGLEDMFCRKQTSWLKDADHEEYRTVRDCGYKRRVGYECYQMREENSITDVCQCDDDACNSAHSLTITAATALLTPLIVRLL